MIKSTRCYDDGKAGAFFIILLLIVIFVVGFKIGKIYFENAQFKTLVEQQAESSLLQPGVDLKARIVAAAASYEASIRPENINITTNATGDQIKILFNYTRTVNLYVIKPSLPFSVTVTKEMAKARNFIKNFQSDVEGGSRGASERALDDIKKKTDEMNKQNQ